jgi:hypothetical protein
MLMENQPMLRSIIHLEWRFHLDRRAPRAAPVTAQADRIARGGGLAPPMIDLLVPCADLR